MAADRVAQRAIDLHENLSMPLDQALTLALNEAAPGPIAPIAKLVVKDGRIVRASFYAPGLPDGEHDVFPDTDGVGPCAGQPISPPDADGSATKEKQHGA